MAGGIKIGMAKKNLEFAVYATALCAAAFDFPLWCPSSSRMSIPLSSSVFLIKCAFRYPAVAHAKKELTEFATISFEPVRFYVHPDRAFLIDRATTIEDPTATA